MKTKPMEAKAMKAYEQTLTAHELARRLLGMPNVKVMFSVQTDSCMGILMPVNVVYLAGTGISVEDDVVILRETTRLKMFKLLD